MGEQATDIEESFQGSAGRLEMILEKKGIGSWILPNFSVKAGDRLILDTLEAIKGDWSRYHNEEFTGTRSLFQDGRICTSDISGSKGFYAKIEYVPPTSERNARIRMTIPFKPDVEGLQQGAVELRTIAELLESKGYRTSPPKYDDFLI